MSTFIFDLDGTIYREDAALPGARETIDALRASGHRALFATNNSTRTRDDYVRALGDMGFDVEPNGLATSAYTTGLYLCGLPRPPRSLLVLGAPALASELVAAGLDARLSDRAPVDAVVVGLDRSFSYERLAAAQEAVLDGALLIATNRDPQFPGRHGLAPGAGSLIAAVETACQKAATTIGKPEPHMYRALLEATQSDPAMTVVVGDSLLTDIPAAAPLGLYTVLVLTGVSRAPASGDGAQPHLVVPSVADLIPALERARPDLMRAAP